MASSKPRSPKRKAAGSSQRANSRQRVTQTLKQAQALNMRIAGASYDQIAQALGYVNRSGAWHAVEVALTRTIQEPADQVRQIELARLDRWLMNIDAQIRAGSLEALDRGLRIMARRAAFQGLDAPAKVAPTTPDGTKPYQPPPSPPDGTFFAELATLFHQLGPMHSNGHSPTPADEPA
jgi:hypothetical protein